MGKCDLEPLNAADQVTSCSMNFETHFRMAVTGTWAEEFLAKCIDFFLGRALIRGWCVIKGRQLWLGDLCNR